MNNNGNNEEIIRSIANYACNHAAEKYKISFPEGDVYMCSYSTDDYEDNDEDIDSPAYEEWLAIDFEVISTITSGPNKNPLYNYITISRKRMPSSIICDGETVYKEDMYNIQK